MTSSVDKAIKLADDFGGASFVRQCMRLPTPKALLEKAENVAARLGFTVSIAILINVWIRYLKTLFKSLHK